MKSLEQAKADKFENCTFKELQSYMEECNIKQRHLIKEQTTAVRKLLDHFSLAPAVGSAAPKVKRSGERVVPDYDLENMTSWGGRMVRMELQRPEHAKVEAAIAVSVGGGSPFWVPYGQVVDVPAPVYMRLNEVQKPRARTERLKDHEGSPTGEVVTVFDFSPLHAISKYSVVESTAHLPCSLLEWYQGKGPQWFNERTLRELQTIAAKVGVNLYDREKKLKVESHLRDDIKVSVFGFADADDVEQAA